MGSPWSLPERGFSGTKELKINNLSCKAGRNAEKSTCDGISMKSFLTNASMPRNSRMKNGQGASIRELRR